MRLPDLFALYKYGFSGSAALKDRRRKRMERVLARINERFPGEPQRNLQAKHLRWFLEQGLRDCKASTRYIYWCEVRLFCGLLKKNEHWLPHLKGPWQDRNGNPNPDRHPGGRPPKKAAAQKLHEAKALKSPRVESGAPRRRRKRRGQDELKREQIDATRGA